MNTIITMLPTLLAMTSFLHIAGAGQCFTDFGDEFGKCRLEGRFKAADYTECCSSVNASGYTESTSWVVFPEYYIFNRKKAQTACQSCADYMSDDSGKKWCFTYLNTADSYCVQSTSTSTTLPARNEADCCLWQNATGYTDDPTWRWSRSYGRWTTMCSPCDKDDLIGCYDQMSIADGQFACAGAQVRMAESSTECCGRKNARAYDLLDRYGRRSRKCFPCPIHGTWSSWSVWSPCSTTCGEHGQRRRIRSCNNPTPQYGGQQCVGLSEQTRACYTNVTICPNDETMSSSDEELPAVWSSWSSFSSCSVTCGNGSWTRQRACLHLPNRAALCEGPTRETLPCQGPPCDNLISNETLARNSNGFVAELNWGPWSPCPVTCGIGIQKRYAACVATPTSKLSTTDASESSTKAGGLSECAEMSFCELDPCPASVLTSESDVALAWTVATLATAVLIISLVVLLCQTRLRDKIEWIACRKEVEASSLSSLERKPRVPSDLPPVPDDVASAQAYCSMDIIQKRYIHDPTTVEREKTIVARHQDDEGYEIPLHGTEITSSAPSLMEQPLNDRVQSENLRNSNQTYYKNGTLAINHVYEQLEFGQPRTAI